MLAEICEKCGLFDCKNYKSITNIFFYGIK